MKSAFSKAARTANWSFCDSFPYLRWPTNTDKGAKIVLLQRAVEGLLKPPASRAMGFLSFNTLFRWMRCDLDRQKHKLHAALTYAAEDDGAELENIWLIVKGKWNAPDLIRLRCCFTSHHHDRSRRLHATRRATQRFRCGFPA